MFLFKIQFFRLYFLGTNRRMLTFFSNDASGNLNELNSILLSFLFLNIESTLETNNEKHSWFLTVRMRMKEQWQKRNSNWTVRTESHKIHNTANHVILFVHSNGSQCNLMGFIFFHHEINSITCYQWANIYNKYISTYKKKTYGKYPE